MNKLFLLSGAIALIAATPIVAKPGGAHGGLGHGPAMHGNSHVMHGPAMHANSHATAKHVRDTRANTHRTHTNRVSAHDQALAHKYGGALCPPGLYKKTPSCVPPGQAKRLFRTGQRVPTNYKYYTPYGDIPQALVNQYDLSDQYRYIYRNNVIYTVDPRTNLITRIINAVL